jgi:ribonuclease I
MSPMNMKRTTPAVDEPRSAAAASNRSTSERNPSAPSTSAVNHDAIAKLAFQKWQKRGCPNGEDQKDWFEAERELRAGQTQPFGSRRGL